MVKQDKNKINQFGNCFIDLVDHINYCNAKTVILFLIIQCVKYVQTPKRDQKTICVVEDIRVMMAVENTHQFKGVYHVLGGLISPMDGIGPKDIKVEELVQKVENGNVKEIIFTLSTTMEGDTTNFYLFRRLKDTEVKISSISRGISIGDELEYTDEITLGTTIISRLPYENSLSK